MCTQPQQVGTELETQTHTPHAHSHINYDRKRSNQDEGHTAMRLCATAIHQSKRALQWARRVRTKPGAHFLRMAWKGVISPSSGGLTLRFGVGCAWRGGGGKKTGFVYGLLCTIVGTTS